MWQLEPSRLKCLGLESNNTKVKGLKARSHELEVAPSIESLTACIPGKGDLLSFVQGTKFSVSD